jgi:serine/threonine protein kinase
MTDRVGEQFGNYRLVRLLGEGGFAEVYLGEHLHLDTRVAIKVLQTQLTSQHVDQFRAEARTIARLEHPHIVRVLDFGVQDKTPYLVMSYAPNGTLRDRHPKGSVLPIAKVVSYVRDVAEALQYAHDERVIHRDIKPENILLGRHHELVLSDFGIAIVAQSSRYKSILEMAGTMAYMAPEQIQGKPRPASDQYALGVVVYEWLTGDRPFHGSLTEILAQHLSVAPPPPRKKSALISPAVERVVLKALAKEPGERFARVRDFALALEEASYAPAPQISPSPAGQTSQSPPIATSPVQQRASTADSPLSQRPAVSRVGATQTTRESWLFDGLTYIEQGRYTEALAAFENSLAHDPTFGQAYSSKGLALYHLRQYVEALAPLERALVLDPNDISAWYGKGMVLEQLQHYAEALAAYKRMVQLDASLASAWRKQGDVLFLLNRKEEALSAYESALQLNSTDADAYIGKGRVLKALGRRTDG